MEKRHAIIIDFKAIRYMLNVAEICNQVNIENPNSDIEYIVLQNIDDDDTYKNDPAITNIIAKFYEINFRGNQDFMHIPNNEQVQKNKDRIYPIIIARCKKTKEIIGISTIKYKENIEEAIDPYFPYKDDNHFEITGILTKQNTTYKGIGKKIYEIAIRAHIEFANKYNDTSMMCVIDCRNKNSLNAIYNAVENIDSNLVPKIVGIYTLTDDNGKMIEAPTFVIKLEQVKDKSAQRPTIEFKNYDNDDTLYDYLLDTLKENYEMRSCIRGYDDGYHVNYYSITPSVLPIIIPNNTAERKLIIPNTDKVNNSNGN